jgi:hypothetical protein
LNTAQAARPRHEARQRWRRATWTRRKNPHDRGRSAARFSAPSRQVSRARRDAYRWGIFRVPAGATCSTQCHGGCSSGTRGTGSHQPRSPLPGVAKDHLILNQIGRVRHRGDGRGVAVAHELSGSGSTGHWRAYIGGGPVYMQMPGGRIAGTGFEASVKHSRRFACCQAMVNHSHPRQSQALPNSECRSKGRD